MRKLIIFLTAVLTLAILAGCKNSPEIGVINKPRKIGVISLLRDEFHSVYVGTTIFQNKTNFQNTSSWGLSSMAANSVVSRLKNNRNFTVRKAKYSKAELLNIKLGTMGAFSSTGPFLKELNKIGRQQGFDTLVLISPITLDQAMFKIYKVGEYGHYHRYSPILKDHLCTYIKYGMSIYDVRKGEVIGSRFTTTTDYRQGAAACSDKTIGGIPSRMPEGYIYQEKFSSYPSSQVGKMKNTIRKQLQALLKKDVECLKLAPVKNGKFREEGCGIFD